MVDSESDILKNPAQITEDVPKKEVASSSPSPLQRAFARGLVQGLEDSGVPRIIEDLASGRIKNTELSDSLSRLILELPKDPLKKYNPNKDELSRLNKYTSLTTEELRDRLINQDLSNQQRKEFFMEVYFRSIPGKDGEQLRQAFQEYDLIEMRKRAAYEMHLAERFGKDWQGKISNDDYENGFAEFTKFSSDEQLAQKRHSAIEAEADKLKQELGKEANDNVDFYTKLKRELPEVSDQELKFLLSTPRFALLQFVSLILPQRTAAFGSGKWKSDDHPIKQAVFNIRTILMFGHYKKELAEIRRKGKSQSAEQYNVSKSIKNSGRNRTQKPETSRGRDK